MFQAVNRFAAVRVQPIEYRSVARGTLAVGRVLLALIFLISGLNQLAHFGEVSGLLAERGINPASFFLGVAVALELVGSALLVIGLYTRIASFLLIVFIVPVTVMMHDFWNYEGALRQLQTVAFLKNLAILGGLLGIFGAGAGAVSVDARIRRAESNRPGAARVTQEEARRIREEIHEEAQRTRDEVRRASEQPQRSSKEEAPANRDEPSSDSSD